MHGFDRARQIRPDLLLLCVGCNGLQELIADPVTQGIVDQLEAARSAAVLLG